MEFDNDEVLNNDSYLFTQSSVMISECRDGIVDPEFALDPQNAITMSQPLDH